MVDGRRLEIVDKFNAYVKPVLDEAKCKELNLTPFTQEITTLTGIELSELENAPTIDVVWPRFCEFIQSHNYSKKKWDAPIRAGYNIINYDNVIVRRLAKQYGPWDDEYQCDSLFHPIHNFDIMNITYYWTENMYDIRSISLDNIRTWMGMDNSKAHRADFDTEQEAALLIKYLKLARNIAPKTKFKGAFAKNA
jgi:DNA polymerase III epsilon subunit-like protein